MTKLRPISAAGRKAEPRALHAVAMGAARGAACRPQPMDFDAQARDPPGDADPAGRGAEC
jgi:hypothetical protein